MLNPEYHSKRVTWPRSSHIKCATMSIFRFLKIFIFELIFIFNLIIINNFSSIIKKFYFIIKNKLKNIFVISSNKEATQQKGWRLLKNCIN